MNRRAAGLVLGAALLLLAGSLAVWWVLGRGGRRGGGSAAPAAGPAGPETTFAADLYFPADTGLRAEHRNLVGADAPKERIRKIVQALLAGPTGAGLVRPLPPGVEVGAIAISPDGTAFLDLRWADHDDPPAGGSDAEMQAVYSVVDSIALNVPEAQRVALLWNGTQRLSFSGHLDTSHPLLPNRQLIGH
jgi:Sporulation and spore germination